MSRFGWKKDESYLLSAVLQPYSRRSYLELAGDPAPLHYALFSWRGDSGAHRESDKERETQGEDYQSDIVENKDLKHLLKILSTKCWSIFTVMRETLTNTGNKGFIPFPTYPEFQRIQAFMIRTLSAQSKRLNTYSDFLDNCLFPLELLSFKCKAWGIDLYGAGQRQGGQE